MRLETVLTVLRQVAPEGLAEPWDHVGLHVGDPAQIIRRALLCIDLTNAVLEEAVSKKVNLIVTYHPPIFDPLSALTTTDPHQRLILKAAQQHIALYSPHTALDAAVGGINDWLCQGLGTGTVMPIKPTTNSGSTHCKLVTFVPLNHAAVLRQALADAGAGQIGNYSECSFNLIGQGTFRGGAGSNPTIGKIGCLEQVEELRVEMVCPSSRMIEVIAALYRHHPYEEPAFDIYPLQSPPRHDTGAGRILTLDKPISLTTLVQRLKRRLRLPSLEVASPQRVKQLRRIAVCAGAGGALLHDIGKVDAFITGEMRHHDVLSAQQRNMAVLLAGHTQTERPYLPTYRQRLQQAGGKAIAWLTSRQDRPPSRRR